MTVTYNLRSIEGASLMLTLPDPARIPIPDVRDAVDKFAKRAEQHRAARAAVELADGAVARAREEVESEAADAAEDGGAVPAKKLVKKLRAAQDTLDEARIELNARDAALRKAHARVVETIRHHAPAWRAATASALDSSILKLTTGREMTRKADTQLQEALGVLGLLDRLTTGLVTPGIAARPIDNVPSMVTTDKSGMHVSVALDAIGAAIGEAMSVLDREKGAERSSVDVVVEVPGEDQVDETPAPVATETANIVIGADDEADDE